MCVHYMCAWCSQMPEEVIGFPGTEVRGGCKLPYVCWESLFSSPDPQVSHTGTLSGTTYFFFRGLGMGVVELGFLCFWDSEIYLPLAA